MADGLLTSNGRSGSDGFDIDQADAFLIDVEGFEGPLHLLLGLARRQKVDLRRVSVLHLAEQYLEFITNARDKRIDLAADYLLMAAWLAYLKSRLLLPKPERSGDDDGTSPDDLASRLAFRLQRLEAMREAADSLMDGDLLGRDIFPRGLPERPVVIRRAQYNTRLIDLMAAFAKIQTRSNQEKPHEVVRQYVLPLEQARLKIESTVTKIDDWSSLAGMATDEFGSSDDTAPRRSRLASLFAASLDLTKARRIDLRQDGYGLPVLVRRMDELQGDEAHGGKD